jgi:EVE domain
VARAWLLQANPKKWDIWSWWEDQRSDLDSWTIAIHTDDVKRNDDFALWISGPQAGVYAIGKFRSGYYGPFRVSGGYWIDPPQGDVYGVDIEATRYLFDHPILKPDLAADPDFSRSLVLRMPGTANPIPLKPHEWQAIKRRVGNGRLTSKPPSSSPIVSARPLGEVPEDITVPTRLQEQKRTFREAQLVKRYEASVGRQLLARSVRLPSGELLVCDIFDVTRDQLIEAKASASRQDVRMAIGQLFDYRRHLGKGSSLALLLPERPSDDVLDLLRALRIATIVETSRGKFQTIN